MVKVRAVDRAVCGHRLPGRPGTGLTHGPAHRPGDPADRARDRADAVAVAGQHPHLVNLQRGLVGLAATHLEPGGLPSVFGGMHNGGGRRLAVTESTTVAVCVIVGWIVVWTALGAWRMVTRDA